MKGRNELPVHVAIIMDGNGRWAEQRRLPRPQGHLEGVKRVEEIVETARKTGIKVLTLYTFSLENWRRPREEVSLLMKTLINVLNRKIEEISKNDIRLQFLGRKDGIPLEVKACIAAVEQKTKQNSSMILNVAFNYGGRQEIVDAIRKISSDVLNGQLGIEEITEEIVSETLYTQGLPDPDLLIRTSGEMRISNFLLWQLSYTELYFTEKFWPEFTSEEFEKALEDYQTRERRYGNIEVVH